MHPSTRSTSVVPSARPAARSRATTLLLAAALFGVGACSDDEVSIPETASTVEVTPKFSTVVAGQTRQLAAQAKNAAGANISNDDVVWRSLDTTVARVSQSGLVTVLSSGATAITATARGQSGFATIEAVGVVASVSIVGPATLPVQQTIQMSATPTEVNGRALFRPVTWASSAPTVATVSATGLVTTLTPGTTNITATSEGKVATLAFTVLPPPPVNTITLAINSGFLPTTVGVPLGVTLRDAAGGVLSGRVITYTSSNPAVATVTNGVVTALTTGNVTITVTSEGKTATASFTALNGLRSGTGQTFGQTVDGQALYAIYVPAGSTNLTVTLRNGNGDPDLYLFRPGNTATPVCSSENGGTTVVEDCVAATPAAGVWVALVYAFTTHAGTTITATVTPTPPSNP